MMVSEPVVESNSGMKADVTMTLDGRPVQSFVAMVSDAIRQALNVWLMSSVLSPCNVSKAFRAATFGMCY